MNSLDTKTSIPSNSLKLSSPSSPSFYPSASSLSSKNDNNNYNYVEQSQTPSITPLPIPASSPSNKPSIFLIVGAAIIILGGIFYLVKLMRREKHKKSKKRNGGGNNNNGNVDSSNERNSFVQNYGSNLLNNWTPLQQEDVNAKKKITAADHLEAIKRFFSQLFHLNNDNKKKEERDANLELELSSLESQEIQRKNHHRSFNSNPYNNKSTIHHPINNALNNVIIKSPSPVYHFPSPSLSLSTSSSLSSIPDSPKTRNYKYGNSRTPYSSKKSYSSINNSNPSINS